LHPTPTGTTSDNGASFDVTHLSVHKLVTSGVSLMTKSKITIPVIDQTVYARGNMYKHLMLVNMANESFAWDEVVTCEDITCSIVRLRLVGEAAQWVNGVIVLHITLQKGGKLICSNTSGTKFMATIGNNMVDRTPQTVVYVPHGDDSV
jgi:hypothetical protein